MSDDYLLEMRSIVKKFGAVRALDGINIKIRAGECLGLCGENGAGKSTLMKVLSGVYPSGSWEGEILWQGKSLNSKSMRDTENAGIVIIHQELMLIQDLSVAENIFMGRELTTNGRINYSAMYHHASELMQELRMPGVNVTLPVMHYGGGHQQLIEIAKALNKNAKLLILDEPSSSLTSSEISVLLDIVRDLKSKGVACVYISHKLDEIEAVCDTISVIRDGKHIATTPMDSMNVNQIITQMVGREISDLYPDQEHEIGEVVFEAKHITCYDVENPQRKCVDDVSFSLCCGEILGVAGLVGAGRTEMVSALFGSYLGRSSAEVFLEGIRIDTSTPLKSIQLGLCMVPEDRKKHGIIPDFSVGHNITLTILENFSRYTLVNEKAEHRAIETEIGQLQLKTSSPFLPIVQLSGGNQQKAVLAKMLLARPKILILDEPTRGVDVGAKAEIYRLIADLARQGIAIIMVSSELPEILGISDRVIVISEGELRADFVNKNLTQETIMAAAINKFS